MNKFTCFALSGGGSLPTIAFGTGTTYFDRGDEVADGVLKGIRAGYRLLDTAQQYKTEKGVGEGIKQAIAEGLVERKDLFVTTKFPPKDQPVAETVKFVNESLKLLQLDYLDCVMIHFPALAEDYDPTKNPTKNLGFFENCTSDPVRAPEVRMAMWEALQLCQKEGKIKHLGVSNFARKHIEGLLKDPRCKVKPAVNQIEFNPYCCDDDILKSCEEHGIVVQAYSPIGSGTKVGAQGETQMVLDDPVLKDISARVGCTVGQLCIAWALRRHVAVATKTEKEARLVENIEASKFAEKLTNEDIARIGALNVNLRKFHEVYKMP